MRRFANRAIRWAAAGVVLGGLLALPVAAQELKPVQEKRVSLRLEKAEAAKVLGQLARALDARLELQCATPAPVTIAFENLTPQTAFSAICETAGLQWQLVEGPERVMRVTCAPAPPLPLTGQVKGDVRVVKKVDEVSGDVTEKITLDLNEAKVEEVMKLAADLMDAKLLLDDSLGGKTVTYKGVNEPISQALDGLCQQVGAKWVLQPGTPPTLKVTAKP